MNLRQFMVPRKEVNPTGILTDERRNEVQSLVTFVGAIVVGGETVDNLLKQ
jgi:hypothetical protein